MNPPNFTVFQLLETLIRRFELGRGTRLGGVALEILALSTSKRRHSAISCGLSASIFRRDEGFGIARSLLDVEILFLLRLSPHNGYSLRKAIFEAFGMKISFGTLYPHLKALEKSGIIAAQQKPGQSGRNGQRSRVLQLTRKGRFEFEREIRSISMLLSAVEARIAKN
jgi:DNA-binding PadR family transcriptional regulator